MNMEGFSGRLQPSLSLKKLSAIALVGFLCKHPDVRKKIKKSISNKKKDKGFPSNGIRNGILEVVSKILKELNVPKEIKTEAESTVILLGDEITRWAKYVIETLKLSITYTEKICFTPFGTIDDVQIFKKFWKHDHKLSKVNDQILLHTLACIHVDEEFIKKEIAEMILKSKHFYGPVKILTENKIVNIIGVYIVNYDRGGLNKNEQSDFYKDRKIVDEFAVTNLFHMSISNGFVKPAKYFYDLLNEKEKRKEIISAAETCLEKGNYWASNEIEERKNAEILLWLINTMPLEQRHYFLMENIDEVMNIFLVALPYQEISLKILDEKWVDLISSKHETMIESIISGTSIEHLSKCGSSRKIFQEAFKKMLNIASKKVKEETFIKKRYNLEECFDVFDVNYLNLIINDKDLEESRSTMIAESETKIRTLIKNKNVELLAGFILEVLRDNERKDFIKKWDLLDKFLMCENLKIVEKILNFLISSIDDPGDLLSSGLDSRGMCYRFIEKGRNDLVDKYLKWHFQVEETTLKKSLTHEWSIGLNVFKIWTTENDAEEAKKRTLNFLKWKFPSNNEMNRFIKERLIKNNDAVVQTFCLGISKSCKGKNIKEDDYAKKFEMIEEFLKFCSKTPKDIKNVKKYVADDIKKYWADYGTARGDFMILKSLINWVYKDNKSEKEKVIKNYLNSREGVVFLNAMRESVDAYGWDPFLNYLNTWHKSFSNKKKMRKEMRPLDEVVFPAQVMGKLSALILSPSYTAEYTVEHTKGVMAAATDFGYKFYTKEELEA